MPRHRLLRIGLIVVLALFVVLFAGGIVVVRSHVFHRYLLATIIEQGDKATGGRLDLGDFTFTWSGLDIDLYRVALHGTEPSPEEPLLRADHIRVGLKVLSLWRRKINVREIAVDHPVVRFLVDAHGHNNLPQTPPSKPGTRPTSVFDLAIGHVVLSQGAIYYNDLETSLDAEVQGLHVQVSFDPLKTEYSGNLGYRQGRVRFGDYNPLEHDLEAQFSAVPSGLTLKSLRLTSGASRVTVRAHLADYANPAVDGSYDVAIATTQFKEILKNSSLPAGEIFTKGAVHYRSSPGAPLLDTLSVKGELSSPALAIDAPQARAGVRALHGDYSLRAGALEVHNLGIDILGGHVLAELTMQHLATTPEARLTATVRGLSLVDATTVLRTKAPLRISGRLDAGVEAAWRGSMEDLQVRSDATIAGSTRVPSTGGAAGRAIPLNGAVHVQYDGADDVITLHQTFLRTPHTAVNLEGTVSKRSALAIQAQSNDLQEIDALLLAVRTASATGTSSRSHPPELLGLGGSASFRGQMQGTTKRFRVTGNMSGANLRYQSVVLPALQANVSLAPSGIALHQGVLETSAQRRVQFDADVALTDWSYTARSPIKVRVTARGIPVTDVQNLASLHYPVTGTLSVNLEVHGSQTSPAGQGSVRLSQASAWNQPIQDLSVQFHGDGSDLHSTISLHTPAGSGAAKLTYSLKREAYDAQVSFPDIQLERLKPVEAGAPGVIGVVTVSAQGRGTLKAPQLEATVEAPKLRLQGQKLDGLKLQARVARQQATFSLDSNVVGAYVQARGVVNLNADYDATVNLDTRSIQLGPLLATYLSADGIRGQTELHAWLKGPLKRPKRIEAHVEIPVLNAAYQSLQIAAASPIRAGYQGGTLTLDHCELKGTDTDLQLQAAVPVASGGAMRASATGNVNLAIIQLLNPEYDSSGQLTLNVSAQGTRAHPTVGGVVQVVDAAFQTPGAPLGAEKVNAEFEVQKDRVVIKRFTAESGGGTITAQGFATYQPAVQFSVGLSAKQVRLRYPEGTRTVFDSTLTLSGTPRAALLSGQVLIDGVSFTESFDLATFADQFSGPSSPGGGGFADNLKLDVGVKSTGEMALSSSELSIQGSADLHVTGTADDPVILGRTLITGGEMFFNNRRFQVQNGVIEFVNPVRTEPVVNVQVTTTVQQFNLSLNFVGPIDRLRTTYTSDPPLPPVDIINLIATGHTTEAASANPTTPQSLLAGQLAGQVSSRVGKLAGISSLTIDPQIGGNQSNPGARLAIQQRVTKNLFFTFATDVTSSQGQVIQVEYQISRKYSLSTMRSQDGGYSVQVKMRRTF